jgi:hypothetical protein
VHTKCAQAIGLSGLSRLGLGPTAADSSQSTGSYLRPTRKRRERPLRFTDPVHFLAADEGSPLARVRGEHLLGSLLFAAGLPRAARPRVFGGFAGGSRVPAARLRQNRAAQPEAPPGCHGDMPVALAAHRDLMAPRTARNRRLVRSELLRAVDAPTAAFKFPRSQRPGSVAGSGLPCPWTQAHHLPAVFPRAGYAAIWLGQSSSM